MVGLFIAWILVLVLLLALWIRLFPTREDLQELAPIAASISPLIAWTVGFVRARLRGQLLSRATPLIDRVMSRFAFLRGRSFDTSDHTPVVEGSDKIAALGRIHRMNGEGGGLALATSDPGQGALSVTNARGALSASERKPV